MTIKGMSREVRCKGEPILKVSFLAMLSTGKNQSRFVGPPIADSSSFILD